MYQFWYDYLKVKYNNKIQLIYIDTDSFVIEVETDDVYKDSMKMVIYTILVITQKITLISV